MALGLFVLVNRVRYPALNMGLTKNKYNIFQIRKTVEAQCQLGDMLGPLETMTYSATG